MTVYIEKPATNLREELAALRAQVRLSEQEVFWFSGDSSNTSFALPRGWKPKFVYVDGGLYREGSAEDYTVSYDGFIYTVVMAVAPAAVDVGIIAQRDM
jgi:hypothetical protein